jgi:outer membrane protein assembly factor BamD
MFINKQIVFSSILIVALGVQGCKSKFEKLKASTNIAQKYQEGVKLYDKKSYTKALSLFDDLVGRYRGQSEAEDLYYYYSYTHYHLRDYITARYHFKIFADTYPSSPKAEECRYMAAYCFYLESPTYSLDQANTIKAIEALQLFINLYPTSDRSQEAAKLIQDLRDKLEIKSFENAKMYLEIGDYKSAVIAFKNSMRDYPDTKFAEEMEYLTIQAQYLYAKNSFENKQEERFNEAIQLYGEFIESYPGSKFTKAAEQYKTESEKGIENAKKVLALEIVNAQ